MASGGEQKQHTVIANISVTLVTYAVVKKPLLLLHTRA